MDCYKFQRSQKNKLCKMDVIKEKALNLEHSCFICVKPAKISEELLNSLKLFFKYLKVGEIKAFVCEECGKKLRKFGKLWMTLEKVKMEMDYLLDFIRSEIDKKDKPGSGGNNSTREFVRNKCKEAISKRKPEINLERIDQPKLDKPEELDHADFDFSADSSPNWNNDLRGRIKCPKCPRTFSTKYVLKRHNDAVHLRLKPFKCSECPKSFRKNCDLLRHINSVHLRQKPFKCSECTKSFSRRELLRHHLRIVHNSQLDKPFKDGAQRQKIKSIIPTKIVSNEKTSANLQTDQEEPIPQLLPPPAEGPSSKTGLFSCDICGKGFTSRGNLKVHVASVHDKKRHYCQAPDCTRSFAKSQDLTSHYRLSHPDFAIPPKPPKEPFSSDKFAVVTENGEDLFKCKLCPTQLKNLKAIRKHISVKHSLKKFLCEDCGYATASKGFLKRHVQLKHGSGGGDGVPCEFCGKLFNSVNYLNIHIKMIHLKKKFKCQECSYESSSKSEFDKHLAKCLEIKCRNPVTWGWNI